MAALSIITVKFVAIGLSRELAGSYNSAYGYLQFFGILADFGLYAVAVRELSRSKDEGQTMGSLVLLRIATTLIAFSIAIGIAWSVPAWRGTILPLGITIAAFVPIFTLLAGIQRSVFQVHYRMHFVFIAEVMQRIVTAGLIAATVLMGIRGSTDPQVALWFLLVGSIGAFVLLVLSSAFARTIIRIRAVWDKETIMRVAKLALPFGAAYLCMALYRNMDVTLIALLRPDFEVQNALYGFALRANEMAFLIPTFLLNSTLPILTKRMTDGENVSSMLRKTFLTIVLLSIVACAYAMAWSRPLMQLLTTELYMSTPTMPGSDTALFLLGPSMFLNGLVLFSFYLLLAIGKGRALTITLAIAAVASQVMNIILIPHLGFVGAALTCFAVQAGLSLSLLWIAGREARFSLTGFQWMQCGIFTLLLVALLMWTRQFLTTDIHTAVILPLTLLALGVFAWAVGLLKTLR